MALDKALLARRFGRAAPDYLRHARIQERAAAGLVDALLREPLPPRPRILDVGCGTGLLTARLLDAFPGATALAVDLAEGMVEEARRQLEGRRVAFGVGDIEEGFPPGEFDVIASSMTLQWMLDPCAVLLGAAGRLAPGGVLGICVPVEGTLPELRAAYVEAAAELGLASWRHPGPELHALERWAGWARAAFEEVEVEEVRAVERYPRARAVLEAIRGVGANDCGGGAGPAAVRLLRRALARYDERHEHGGIPAAWRLAVLTARHPRRSP
jgi:malonyl-CoA O-methyltransferase